jgi:uncharacterized glyoxalase superfamily protein PhnB
MITILYSNDSNCLGHAETGVEIRMMGINPDAAQRKAEAGGAKILQPATDFRHGWRDVMLEDPDGYIWAVGVLIP